MNIIHSILQTEDRDIGHPHYVSSS